MKLTHMLSKLLISLCIVYHIWIHNTDARQSQRFEINSKNNIIKYLHPYEQTTIVTLISEYMRRITFGTMGVGAIGILISKYWAWKAIAIFGVCFYNVLIPHFHVIVPNYVALKEWIGVVAALLYLTVEENRK